MILSKTKHNIERDLFGEKKFGIDLTAKTFEILFSGLYSDKVSAVIRELCCNAHESHILAKSNIPFKISLPKNLQTNFIIEDFGTGLSEEDIMELYTTLFRSTKETSNKFMGCLGLGSKTPFALTDSFNIESRFNGKKSQYISFLNGEKIPSILKTGEFDTDEVNGLTIKIPISKDYFYEFYDKSKNILKFFPIDSFVLKNEETISHYTNDYINIFNNLYVEQNYKGYSKTIYIKMGNIIYPLDINEIDIDNKDFLLSFDYSLLIDVPIGSCDIQASREKLSYDQPTKKFLNKTISSFSEIINKECDILNDKKLSKFEIYDEYAKLVDKYSRKLIQKNLNHHNQDICFLKMPEYQYYDSKHCLRSTTMFDIKTLNSYSDKFQYVDYYNFKINLKHIYQIDDIIILDKNFNNRKIKKYREDNPDKKFMILYPNKRLIYLGLTIENIIDALKKHWENRFNIIKISDIKIPKNKYIKSNTTVIINQFLNYTSYNRWNTITEKTFNKINFNDPNNIFIKIKGKTPIDVDNEKLVLLLMLGINIYGIRNNGLKFCKNIKISNNIDLTKKLMQYYERLPTEIFHINYLNEKINKFHHNSEIFLDTKYYKLFDTIDQLKHLTRSNEYVFLNQIITYYNIDISNHICYNFFDLEYGKMLKEIENNFPLLEYLNTRFVSDINKLKAIQDYIKSMIKKDK